MNFVEFCLFLSQYFLYNLVKYCSIFQTLDNVEEPTNRTVEKCPSAKSSVHYRPINCQMKSIKSFAGHHVQNNTIPKRSIEDQIRIIQAHTGHKANCVKTH